MYLYSSFPYFCALKVFKQKALEWASSFSVVVYLDSNGYAADHYSQYECLIGLKRNSPPNNQAVDPSFCMTTEKAKDSFERLQAFVEQEPSWLFGFLTYDLKNDVEQLSSRHLNQLHFPKLCFFRPDVIIAIPKGVAQIQISCTTASQLKPTTILTAIQQQVSPTYPPPPTKVSWRNQMSRKNYLQKVKAIQEHIRQGDVYEMNLCQAFYLEHIDLLPLSTFQRLNALTQAPFASFVKLEDKYLFCGSPERFLQKQGKQLISQPIKGTIKRGKSNIQDEQLRQQLQNDPKERAENVMIVDLVRNDLTRSARFGTIKVPELFGTYTFKTVHHLISTISAELRTDTHFITALKNAFPMGSMTGAPKIMAMQLIEQYENSKRGLYSGSVGYITPDGNFDFNVVIRSILYNKTQRYASLQVGSAITYDAVAEREYEECLLKAEALFKVLGE